MKQRRSTSIQQQFNKALRNVVKNIDHKHQENTDRLIRISEAMQAHIEADSASFKLLGEQIVEVNKDVKDLLSSRSFLRGAWFAIGVFGTLIAAITGAILTWFK